MFDTHLEHVLASHGIYMYATGGIDLIPTSPGSLPMNWNPFEYYLALHVLVSFKPIWLNLPRS